MKNAEPLRQKDWQKKSAYSPQEGVDQCGGHMEASPTDDRICCIQSIARTPEL